MFLVGSAFCAGFFVFLLIFAYIVFDRETANMRGTQSGEVLPGIREEILWVPDLNLNFAFSFDALSLFFALIVTGVGFCVMLYCAGYFNRRSPTLLFGLSIFGFIPAMLGLVFADNLYLLFVFWELTSVLSFLLISHNCNRYRARSASMEAFLVTAFGGICMLIGFILLASVAGTASISQLLAQALPYADARLHIALALILMGAIAKSAIFPLHFWLPGAMIAPTPVSAFLHSATMVKAGVYLILRFAPIWHGIWWISLSMILLGGIGAVLGGIIALRRYDLKSILAYGTLSQLGLFFALFAVGSPGVTFAAIAYILAHAVFKSGLFLAVGIIDRKYATRDFRKISHLRKTPAVFILIIALSLSMAGLPITWGFVAKEAIIDALLHDAAGGNFLGFSVLGVLFVTSILTFAYTLRLCIGVCVDKRSNYTYQGKESDRESSATKGQAGDGLLVIACAVLAALGPGFAGIGVLLESGFARITRVIGREAEDLHLPHLVPFSFSVPFLISVLIWTIGGTLSVLRILYERRAGSAANGQDENSAIAQGSAGSFAFGQGAVAGSAVAAASVDFARTGVARWRNRGRFISAHTAYRLFLLGLDRFAAGVAAAIQLGSLPIYLLGIFLTCIFVFAFGSANALTAGNLPSALSKATFSWDIFLFVLIGGIAAIFSISAKKRFQGALLLGVGGIAQAGVYAFAGAPDLALTQVVIEITILAAFVFVLRRLKAYHEPSSGIMPLWRIVIAGLFALGAIFALFIFASARVEHSDGLAFGKLATEEGHGKNFVNVTLVDIRAWDTMGELLVLVAAATGVASLIFVRNRGRLRNPFGTLPLGIPIVSSVLWFLFPVVILLSLYLLFVGHNLPGGGFVGGAVAGLGFVLIFLGGGYDVFLSTLRKLRINAAKLLSIGLSIAFVSAIGPMVAGYPPFSSFWMDISIKNIGQFVFVSSSIFDIGVYFVVLGLALDVLRSLGAEVELRGVEEDLERVDPAATILDDIEAR